MNVKSEVGEARDLAEIPVAGQELPARWAWFAGLAGPVVTVISVALEPAPADPETSTAVSVLGSLLFMALLALMGLAGAAAVRRQVGALTWAAAASAVTVALSVTCPASGHHTDVGAWWYTQMAISVTALTVATIARSRFRTTP